LVLQSYESNIRYGEREKEILTYVSQQIASAIEAKRHQQNLVESESKFRAVAEAAPAAIFIYRGRKLLYVNPASEVLTGYREDELLKKGILDLVTPEFRPLMAQRLEERLAGDQSRGRYVLQVQTRSGDERWMDFPATPVLYQGEPAVLGVGVDIHERRLAEQEMQLQKAHLEQLFEYA